jgi:hypothetical protein
MNDCTMPLDLPLQRPLWQRWVDDAREWLGRAKPSAFDAESELNLQAAIELNDKTLRDIGAPEWLRDQAAAHRDQDSLMLRAARADLGGGGLRWL